VRIQEKSLSPCVEHREETDLRPQMLGIGGNGAQCLAGRPEQNVVDDVLILKSNGCDWLRPLSAHTALKTLGIELNCGILSKMTLEIDLFENIKVTNDYFALCRN
jgi:hypothetical protein